MRTGCTKAGIGATTAAYCRVLPFQSLCAARHFFKINPFECDAEFLLCPRKRRKYDHFKQLDVRTFGGLGHFSALRCGLGLPSKASAK
jgi:hypothetical protein